MSDVVTRTDVNLVELKALVKTNERDISSIKEDLKSVNEAVNESKVLLPMVIKTHKELTETINGSHKELTETINGLKIEISVLNTKSTAAEKVKQGILWTFAATVGAGLAVPALLTIFKLIGTN